jgi:hypothetical protein
LFQTSQRRAEASLRAVGEVIPTELGKANLLIEHYLERYQNNRASISMN